LVILETIFPANYLTDAVFPTNRLAGTSKLNLTATKMLAALVTGKPKQQLQNAASMHNTIPNET